MIFDNFCLKSGIKDERRFRWFAGMLFLSILSLLIFYFLRQQFFITIPKDYTDYVLRFLYVLPFSFIGFSFFAFIVAMFQRPEDDPWLSYLFNYFPRLIILSLLIFSVLHIFETTSGVLYYFLSAGLSLYLGYNIDWVKPESLLKK
jgi:hypothetical protein